MPPRSTLHPTRLLGLMAVIGGLSGGPAQAAPTPISTHARIVAQAEDRFTHVVTSQTNEFSPPDPLAPFSIGAMVHAADSRHPGTGADASMMVSSRFDNASSGRLDITMDWTVRPLDGLNLALDLNTWTYTFHTGRASQLVVAGDFSYGDEYTDDVRPQFDFQINRAGHPHDIGLGPRGTFWLDLLPDTTYWLELRPSLYTNGYFDRQGSATGFMRWQINEQDSPAAAVPEPGSLALAAVAALALAWRRRSPSQTPAARRPRHHRRRVAER